MLVITPDQMRRLEPAVEEAFVGRLVLEIETLYKEAFGGIPRDVLRLLVEAALQRARALGFEFASSLACFVHLSFAVAPGFHRHPAIRAALSDPAIPLERRIGRLPELIPAAVWDEIVSDYEVSAW